MLIFLTSAAAYFYFNWRYYALTAAMLQLPRTPKLHAVWTFLLNYALFYVCSMLEWNLLVNWALFFLFQLGESAVYCKRDWRICLYLSLHGILHGLTINIFCRCMVAIAVSQPLAAFDNHVNSVGNLKALPVFLGFVLGGVMLHLMAAPKQLERLRTLIAHPKHLTFQLELLGGMFAYLFLNLLLYQFRGDSVFLKLWGIKSAVFSLVGAYLGLNYSLKMCRLSDYREQNRAIRQELNQSERMERQLRTMAYRDMLTETYSRRYVLEALERFLQRHVPFCLCFVDLDGLKGVNDRCGHAEGDRYLITVARELAFACREGRDVLARYGGDEFLLLFPGADVATVDERLQQVNRRLLEHSRRGEAPFPMSVSHGAVDGGGATSAEPLLAAADEKMYREKKQKACFRQ